jgi:sulfide dehydrogenase cytochrome subunit
MRHRLLLTGLASVLLTGPVWAADAPPGASSCTGCHAAKRIPDSVIPRIAGRKADDIAKFMREYRSGAWPSSVMGRIAKGFDDQQIDAIAAWFATQPE